jgi:error-prone DNA polymerase
MLSRNASNRLLPMISLIIWEPTEMRCSKNRTPASLLSTKKFERVNEVRRYGNITLDAQNTPNSHQISCSCSCASNFSFLHGAYAADRIELARAVRLFNDVADLARRAQLDRRDLQVLARAHALRTLVGANRRNALWLAAAAAPDRGLLRDTSRDDAVPDLAHASEGAEVVTDYRAMGFTLGRHPLSRCCASECSGRLETAAQLAGLRKGQIARACALVTVQQRPGTANGIMFLTLEDQTGQTNVIVWPALLEKYRREALGASLLVVYGVWQANGKVRH